LEEETGLTKDHVRFLEDFRFQTSYTSTSQRFGNIKVEKTLVIFACVLKGPQQIRIEDGHHGYQWADIDAEKIHRFPIANVLTSFREFLLQKPSILQPS
jgi:8-oxo-dGTP pyrophosphatase MutT (NUDIX family)